MTVSCVLKGGLSNCLFIISATLAYSMKHLIDYCIPTEIVNPHYEGQKVFYSKNLKYCNGNGVTTATVYKEPHFHFAEIPAPHSRYTVLDGYYQSYRYIEPYREEVLKILNIPYEYKEGKCAICIRRGDYINLPKYHNVVSSVYLKFAQIKMMNAGVGKFEVYSDDIEWCKNYMPQFDNADYYFSEGKTDIEDLSLASSCQNVIMSASSFSWWVAWLGRNEDRKVIYPKTWFGAALKHDTKDLCPANWEAL